MSRFNHYMNSHFSGCRLLARARDECRNRNVSLYQVPGYWDCVGVSDGTDSWIAPASAAPFFKTATGDVADILRRLQAGEPLPEPPEAPRPRQRVKLEEEEPQVRPTRSTAARRARVELV